MKYVHLLTTCRKVITQKEFVVRNIDISEKQLRTEMQSVAFREGLSKEAQAHVSEMFVKTLKAFQNQRELIEFMSFEELENADADQDAAAKPR